MKNNFFLLLFFLSVINVFGANKLYILPADASGATLGFTDTSDTFPMNYFVTGYEVGYGARNNVQWYLGGANDNTATIPSYIVFLSNQGSNHVKIYYDDGYLQSESSIEYDYIGGKPENIALLGTLFTTPPAPGGGGVDLTPLLTIFTDIWNWLKEKFDYIITFLDNILDEISSWLQGIWEHLSNIYDNIVEFHVQFINFVAAIPMIIYNKIKDVMQFLFIPSPVHISALTSVNLYTKNGNDVTIFGVPTFFKASWESASIGLPGGFGAVDFFGKAINIQTLLFQAISQIGLAVRELFGVMLFGFYVLSVYKRYRVRIQI